MKTKILAFVVTLIHIVYCSSLSASAVTSKKTAAETNESFFQQENTPKEVIAEETNASTTNKLTAIITKDFLMQTKQYLSHLTRQT